MTIITITFLMKLSLIALSEKLLPIPPYALSSPPWLSESDLNILSKKGWIQLPQRIDDKSWILLTFRLISLCGYPTPTWHWQVVIMMACVRWKTLPLVIESLIHWLRNRASLNYCIQMNQINSLSSNQWTPEVDLCSNIWLTKCRYCDYRLWKSVKSCCYMSNSWAYW